MSGKEPGGFPSPWEGGPMGYTNIQIMLLVVIIGILVALAVPTHLHFRKKAQSTEARVTLNRIYRLQFSYHSEHDTYTADTDALGLSLPVDLLYTYEILGATVREFSARARANLDRDQTIDTWLVDQTGSFVHVSRD